MDMRKSKTSAPAPPISIEKAVQTIEASPTPLPEVEEVLGLTSHRRGISDVTVRAEREEEDAADRYNI